MHGGGPAVTAGKPLDHVYKTEDLDLLHAGCANLCHHIENVAKFGVQCVVAINQFATDTDAELELVQQIAIKAGAYDAQISNHWALGGAGATKLAGAVESACAHSRESGNPFKFLYPLDLPLKKKIEIICTQVLYDWSESSMTYCVNRFMELMV